MRRLIFVQWIGTVETLWKISYVKKLSAHKFQKDLVVEALLDGAYII